MTQSGDLRLIYGLGVPLVAMIGFIVAFAIAPTWWLLVPLVLLVVAMTAIVLMGFGQMIDDDEESDRGDG